MKNNQKDNVLYPVYDNGELHVTISKGNTKMGNIPNFNTLPGNRPITKKDGTQLTNIIGTCGKHCKECFKACYAVRFVRMHHNACVKPYAMNTLIMRFDPEKLRAAIKEYCEKNVVKYFRFHTSGEIESKSQLELYAQICKDNPEVNFYLYTKAFGVLQDWFISLGERNEEIPDNFVINLSEWHGNLDFMTSPACHTFFRKCNIFSYDDGNSGAKVEAMTHCPAVDKQGHETGITCAQCRRCMKKGHQTAVYAH